MTKIRTKPDRQRYTFDGFGSETFPNFLLRGAGDLNNWHLGVYVEAHEGYQALRKALQMDPQDVVQEVRSSG
ncbi:MAG: NADH-quinone oxidoreductase subunit F, partial [Holophagales bacterium]|nr:NADH-quinone oxidoreductase subunit F [Holophagales bacterium]